MKEYELFYRGVLIGLLSLNENYVSYIANKNNINSCVDRDMILSFLKEDMNFLHPFFEIRLERMNKFSLDRISFENDYYELVFIKK